MSLSSSAFVMPSESISASTGSSGCGPGHRSESACRFLPLNRNKYRYLPLSQGQEVHRLQNDNDNDKIGQTARNNSQTNLKALQMLNNLPIFPLRKCPRFPTDRLTLNLYEERYLQMAAFILSARPPIFGSIFVSGKPHLVTNGGMGSIVPLLQQGDIGTLFLVNDWQDDSLPIGGNDLQAFQRRVRLNAIGFARFRITSIVSDGTFNLSSDPERTSSSTSLGPRCPYILANITLLTDQDDSSTKAWTQQDYETILKGLRESNQKDIQASMDPVLEFSKIFSAITLVSNEHVALAPNYDELFSFFVVSKLLNANRKSPAELVSHLESVSTRERVQYMVDIIRAR